MYMDLEEWFAPPVPLGWTPSSSYRGIGGGRLCAREHATHFYFFYKVYTMVFFFPSFFRLVVNVKYYGPTATVRQ